MSPTSVIGRLQDVAIQLYKIVSYISTRGPGNAIELCPKKEETRIFINRSNATNC